MMLCDIPCYPDNNVIDDNALAFVMSCTDAELETHARAMVRWEMWYHSMEAE